MNKIEWGNNHKLYIKDDKRAELLAYEKAFFFTTYLNGIKVNRQF